MTSPVVEAWATNEVLMTRAAVGRLAVTGDRISREDLVTNEDVIIPILKHCGLRVTVCQIVEHVDLFFGFARPKGKPDIPRQVARVQAWKLKRLVSVFNRVASRGHFPRERAIQRIYKEADIPLPANPRSRSFDDAGADDSCGEGEESEATTDTECELSDEGEEPGDAISPGAAPAAAAAVAVEDTDGPHLVDDKASVLSGSSRVTPPPKGLPEELPSTEKLEKHQVVNEPDGTSRCKKCHLSCPSPLCPTMAVLLSRPCMGYSNHHKVQILYSKHWLDELELLAKKMDVEHFQIIAHSGKMFRLSGNGSLSEIPEPHEFPLLLEPMTQEQLMDELEELKLEEELLEEQLRLLELEQSLNEEHQSVLNDAIAKAPPGCLDAIDTIPFQATLAMENIEIPDKVEISEEKPLSFAEMRGAKLSTETQALPGTGTGAEAEPEMGPAKSPMMETESLENMNPALVRMIMDMGHSKEEAMKIYRDQYANGEPMPKSSEITTKFYEKDGDKVVKMESHRVEEAELSGEKKQGQEAGLEVKREEAGLEVKIEDAESESESPGREEHDREHKRPSALASLKTVTPEEQQPSRRKGRKPAKDAKGRGRGRGAGKGRKASKKETSEDSDEDQSRHFSDEDSDTGASQDGEERKKGKKDQAVSKVKADKKADAKEKTSRKTKKDLEEEEKPKKTRRIQKNLGDDEDKSSDKKKTRKDAEEKPKKGRKIQKETSDQEEKDTEESAEEKPKKARSSQKSKKEACEKGKKDTEEDAEEKPKKARSSQKSKKEACEKKDTEEDEEEKPKKARRSQKSKKDACEKGKKDTEDTEDDAEKPRKGRRSQKSKEETGAKTKATRKRKVDSEDADKVEKTCKKARAEEDDEAVKAKRAKASRKSSAYHVAKKQALKDGCSEMEAVEKAKAAYKATE